MEKAIYKQIQKNKEEQKKMLALLVDPDKATQSSIDTLLQNTSSIDLIFVGGSLLTDGDIEETIALIKNKTNLPVLLFPGSSSQISNNADGILFLSLLSSRNPEMLIGQQVTAAPYLRKTKLEIISTAYLLIESGKQTTASYMSNSTPIPSDKAEIAASTALAGEYLGMDLIYLDAGSGAKNPVPQQMIQKVRAYVNQPIVVGGGLSSKDKIKAAFLGGADIVVIGNALETNPNFIHEIEELKSEIASS